MPLGVQPNRLCVLGIRVGGRTTVRGHQDRGDRWADRQEQFMMKGVQKRPLAGWDAPHESFGSGTSLNHTIKHTPAAETKGQDSFPEMIKK